MTLSFKSSPNLTSDGCQSSNMPYGLPNNDSSSFRRFPPLVIAHTTPAVEPPFLFHPNILNTNSGTALNPSVNRASPNKSSSTARSSAFSRFPYKMNCASTRTLFGNPTVLTCLFPLLSPPCPTSHTPSALYSLVVLLLPCGLWSCFFSHGILSCVDLSFSGVVSVQSFIYFKYYPADHPALKLLVRRLFSSAGSDRLPIFHVQVFASW